MRELPDRPPDIEYPTLWGYRLIGPDPEAVQAAVLEILGPCEHQLKSSHRSASGKYHSFALELTVRDEAHRLELFEAFKAHDAIVYVL
ncbi:MAG: DUF493 domain-containing protein [Planctomycetes bacterium]|nr:DUF493 domain-containing protein [Planctomycetota bacterium]